MTHHRRRPCCASTRARWATSGTTPPPKRAPTTRRPRAGTEPRRRAPAEPHCRRSSPSPSPSPRPHPHLTLTATATATATATPPPPPPRYRAVVDTHGRLPSRTTKQYLAPWPMTISAPYLSDQGAATTNMAPVTGPDGVVKGVSGAGPRVVAAGARHDDQVDETGRPLPAPLDGRRGRVQAADIERAMTSIPKIGCSNCPGRPAHFGDLSGVGSAARLSTTTPL